MTSTSTSCSAKEGCEVIEMLKGTVELIVVTLVMIASYLWATILMRTQQGGV